jgi:phosphatidylinositol dimannoside acyltransferase
MAIEITQIINSALGIRLAMGVGRIFPRRLGHGVADLVAGRIAGRKDSTIVKNVRANQWVVRGETLDEIALDQAVRDTFRNSAHAVFDLYHYVNDLEAASRLIVLDSTTQSFLQRPEFDGRGLMIVGLHTSNFDLCLQWLCSRGMKFLVLTIPNPQGGRRTEYEMRKKSGVNLVPASITTLRQVIRHLQQGGVAVTGIDRPILEPETLPRFFGRPAALPMHHIFLAIKAQVPVMIMAVNLQSDGKYHIVTSDPIEMDYHSDREIQTLQNAEKVLKIAEGFIRKEPQQWSMSLPVWPEILNNIPN